MAHTSRNRLDYGCSSTMFMLGFFKALGLAPFSVQKSSKKLSKNKPWQGSEHMTFVASRLGFFYNMLLITVQFRMLLISLPMSNDIDYPDKSPLTSIIESAEAVIGNVVLIVIWLIMAFRQRTVVNILNRLLSFHGATYCRNGNNFSEPSGRFFVLVFLTNIFVWTVLLCTEQLAYHAWVLTWFSVIVPNFVLTWFVAQYIFAVKLIEKGFGALNQSLSEKSVNSSVGLENRLFFARELPINNSYVPKIGTIRRAHSNLYEIAMEISDFYSFPILLTIAFFNYVAIYVSYYLLVPFVDSTEEQSYLMMVNSIFTIMSVVLPIAMLTSGVTNVTKELKQFAIALVHRKIKFTACGLFPLDCTLLHSIFSTVTTYLIILIQFHMGSNGNASDHETG